MNKITIFTDGSSRGNPGRGGWGSVVVVKSKVESIKSEVIELGGREKDTTNNRMEMTAAIKALEYIDTLGLSTFDFHLTIHTDSSYLINGITKWVKGWSQNNWMTKTKQEVLNKDLWMHLADIVDDKKVKWIYIAGHSGIPGNERCDIIATSFADGVPINLYKGELSSYEIDVSNFEGHLIGVKKSKGSKERSKAKAYSYVSLVGGKLFFDKTWKECEARVKGTKGARYKKALSEIEEKTIAKEFLGK